MTDDLSRRPFEVAFELAEGASDSSASVSRLLRRFLDGVSLPPTEADEPSVGRFVLVGQAPAASTVGMRPLVGGATSRRLRKLLKMQRPEYLKVFARANLVRSYVGRSPNGGDAFPLDLAGRAAARLLGRLPPGDEIVLLGRGVASAFGVPPGVRFFRWFVDGGRRMVVSPHPSGKSRWWNEPANRERARRFYRSLAREARRRVGSSSPIPQGRGP